MSGAARLLAVALNVGAIFLWVWRNPYAAYSLDARSAYESAVEADRRRDYAEAYRLYRHVATAHPGSRWATEAHYQLGRIAMDEVGDLETARAAFEAYLRREPESVSARRRRDLLEAIRGEGDQTARMIVGVFLLADAERFREAAWLAARIPEDRIGPAGRNAVAELLRGGS